MTDEDLAGAERVPVRATGRWVGDPLPGRGLHQFPEHVRSLWSDRVIGQVAPSIACIASGGIGNSSVGHNVRSSKIAPSNLV
jgi:hypothetical protein